jgi:hypothetical protein
VLHAYALIADGIGRFRAVHLTGVTAENVEHLEPNGRPESAAGGMMRISAAMTERHRRKAWNT